MCSNELAMIIQEFEDGLYNSDEDEEGHSNITKKHHENTPSFQKRFFEDVTKLYNNLTCNPFELCELTRIDDTSVIFDPVITGDIKLLAEKGEQQFETFWNDRLIYAKVAISDTVKKNKLHMMSDAAATSQPKDPTLTQAMVTKLRAACAVRQHHATIFFQSEIFGIAQSISTDSRSLYHGNKSDILKRFEKETQLPIHERNAALIIDLSVIVQIMAQQKCTTFKEFSRKIYRYIMNLATESKVERIDIVADRYFEDSLKGATRRERGSGCRFMFDDDTKFPDDFYSNFSKNSKNKDDFNKYLAQKFLIFHESQIILVITFNDSILSNVVLHEPLISSCTSEEADQRTIRHAINLADKGYQHIQIRSVDTDVLILSIAHSETIFEKGANTFYVNSGSGKFFNIKSISDKLGKDVCKALPFFHSFTGCDTVSSFYSHGKCRFFDVWMVQNKVNGELTNLFKTLSEMPSEVTDTHIKKLGSFLMKVYDIKAKCDVTIDIFRMNQFCKSTTFNPRNLIISKKGLLQHTKRACLQAGWIWKECEANVQAPCPTNWGWIRDSNDGSFLPKWQVDMDIFDINAIITTCTCGPGRCETCKCSKKDMKCIQFCNCLRNCKNA